MMRSSLRKYKTKSAVHRLRSHPYKVSCAALLGDFEDGNTPAATS